VIEYLQQNGYPLIEDRNTLEEETPAGKEWDELTNSELVERFNELMDAKPEVAKEFVRVVLSRVFPEEGSEEAE
jgi:hypothetical protein